MPSVEQIEQRLADNCLPSMVAVIRLRLIRGEPFAQAVEDTAAGSLFRHGGTRLPGELAAAYVKAALAGDPIYPLPDAAYEYLEEQAERYRRVF